MRTTSLATHLALPLLAFGLVGCDERLRYEWTATVSGEARRAIVWASTTKGSDAPLLVYFHGRGGDAEDSETRREFHTLWPEATVAYAEGTNFDNRPDGANGWEIRFPHVYSTCNLQKDFLYVTELISALRDAHNVDSDRIFLAGHSSGGFFTLALTEILSGTPRAVAALGAYTSFAPLPNLIDCANTYADGIVPQNDVTSNLALQTIVLNPVPTLFLFGRDEDTIKDNPLAYDADCGKWSYFRISIDQLARKNGSAPALCDNNASYMAQFTEQELPSAGGSGVATRIRPYPDDHSWPAEANTWVVDYFKSFP